MTSEDDAGTNPRPEIKLPEPIVLPDLRDPKVYAALLKKAKQDDREDRRIRRQRMLLDLCFWRKD